MSTSDIAAAILAAAEYATKNENETSARAWCFTVYLIGALPGTGDTAITDALETMMATRSIHPSRLDINAEPTTGTGAAC